LLGWTITGPSLALEEERRIFACPALDLPENTSQTTLARQFRRFNDIEGLGVMHQDEKFTIKHQNQLKFLKENTRHIGDRWEVPMLIEKPGPLPNSESQALKRLHGIHRKMQANPKLAAHYPATVEAELRAGFIRKLSPEEAKELRAGRHWFSPHFPVYHPDKPEKCRRVMDAAARNQGICLNSILDAGPNILNSLVGVLLRFRIGKYAINADIDHYFFQVAVPEQQQSLLAFLWSPDIQTEPDVYVYTGHVFGATCSPTAAISALHRTAEKNPYYEEVIKRSFYMDDFYWSSNEPDDTINMGKKVRKCLKQDGFPLNKWVSNDLEVQVALDPEAKELAEKPFERDAQVQYPTKVLGMIWDCRSDTVTFKTRASCDNPPVKVREALKILASTYDPLGLVAPFVLKGKKIWQAIWYDKKDYNAEIKPQLAAEFSAWMQGLKGIRTLSIPRWFGFEDDRPLQLHIATDASQEGMAAVAYLVQVEGESTFLAAKTRVTPPRDQGNIPRLELHAFLIGTRLMSTLLEELKELDIQDVVFWSDSMVALQWVLGEPVTKDMFVLNRLNEVMTRINEAKKNHKVICNHVESHLNPADMASRGTFEAEFRTKFEFWTKGPSFLPHSKEWPDTEIPLSSQKEIPEMAEAITHRIHVYGDSAMCANTLQKADGPQPPDSKDNRKGDKPSEVEHVSKTPLLDYLAAHISGEIDINSLDTAERAQIRDCQRRYFPDIRKECQRAPNRTAVSKSRSLPGRQFWLDDDDILRFIPRNIHVPKLDEESGDEPVNEEEKDDPKGQKNEEKTLPKESRMERRQDQKESKTRRTKAFLL